MNATNRKAFHGSFYRAANLTFAFDIGVDTLAFRQFWQLFEATV